MGKSQRDKGASEHQIQVAIVQYLDRVLPSDIRAVAVANNPRSKVAGGREKARGMRKGFPDLLLIGSWFKGLLEVKAESGYLSKEQKEWRDWAARHGIPHAVVRSIDDVRETLAEWGVPTRDSSNGIPESEAA